jgi:hypothetical protein
MRLDIRYPAFGLSGYPAKTVSGASLIIRPEQYDIWIVELPGVASFLTGAGATTKCLSFFFILHYII